MMIGVTGSIGAGKSTVLRLLRDMGFDIFDSDTYIKSLYSRDDVIEILRERFPEAFDGQRIDLVKLRAMVFSDLSKLKLLEGTLHPYLKSELDKLVNLYKGKARLHLAVEVPLLIEVGWQDMFDLILIVHAPFKLRLERVKSRGWDEEELLKRERRLIPVTYKMKLCKGKCVLIINDMNMDELKAKLALVLDFLEKF